MLKSIKAVMVMALFSIFLVSGVVQAVPILNVNNGHYYEKITNSGIDWNIAKNSAESVTHLGEQGHLATLTDLAENDWVRSNLGDVSLYLLGGTDQNIEGSWEWVTGEAWSWTNWNTGESQTIVIMKMFLVSGILVVRGMIALLSGRLRQALS